MFLVIIFIVFFVVIPIISAVAKSKNQQQKHTDTAKQLHELETEEESIDYWQELRDELSDKKAQYDDVFEVQEVSDAVSDKTQPSENTKLSSHESKTAAAEFKSGKYYKPVSTSSQEGFSTQGFSYSHQKFHETGKSEKYCPEDLHVQPLADVSPIKKAVPLGALGLFSDKKECVKAVIYSEIFSRKIL